MCSKWKATGLHRTFWRWFASVCMVSPDTGKVTDVTYQGVVQIMLLLFRMTVNTCIDCRTSNIILFRLTRLWVEPCWWGEFSLSESVPRCIGRHIGLNLRETVVCHRQESLRLSFTPSSFTVHIMPELPAIFVRCATDSVIRQHLFLLVIRMEVHLNVFFTWGALTKASSIITAFCSYHAML